MIDPVALSRDLDGLDGFARAAAFNRYAAALVASMQAANDRGDTVAVLAASMQAAWCRAQAALAAR